MKIKIISDGKPQNTKVLNADTDEIVEGICGISWQISVDDIATVNLKMRNVPVDVIGYDITELGMKYRKYSYNDNILWNHILK